MVQSLTGKQHNYFGSTRGYYSGLGLGSTTAWSFVNFSGTNTGIGTQGNTEANRLIIASSGTSFAQFSYNSGLTLAGEVYGGDTITLDGVSQSGIWIRSNSASQLVQVWGW